MWVVIRRRPNIFAEEKARNRRVGLVQRRKLLEGDGRGGGEGGGRLWRGEGIVRRCERDRCLKRKESEPVPFVQG